MEKSVYAVILVLFAVALGRSRVAQATEVVSGGGLTEGAVVCFVDFRIGLVVGKSEADIGNKKYCRYSIERKIFLSLIKFAPPSNFYMSNNVRAKVIFSQKDIYYIDYNGVVRHGGERFQIDKSAFTKTLHRLYGEDIHR
jgi:hypothetical protein